MIDEIIKREWEFFKSVHNREGPTFCQKDFDTFEKQRSAQFLAYNEETLNQYLQDLIEYQKVRINPMFIKYSRMEKDNNGYIPLQTNQQKTMISLIMKLLIEMREEFNQKYPSLNKYVRISYSYQDNEEEISFETYYASELSTYSLYTLQSFINHLLKMVDLQQNFVEIVLTNTVKAYGYKSLYEVEKKLK